MEQSFSLLGMAGATSIALIFARAAFHKLTEFTEFTGFVADYRILPAALVGPAAAALVLTEVAVVIGTVTPGVMAPALALGAGLFLLYALAMGINVLRGRTTVECGCGGAAQPLGAPLVLRNIVLAVIAGLSAVAPVASRAPGAALAAIAVGAMLTLTFLIVDRILSNAALAQRTI
ncbi:MauE/DoxX family redox-associated membrane protein [Celeribacter baekdonensis]|uniref:Methylamine utilization protein MauE n=1 Tax=Celeribacter baekdonensis B30 TaxID=1208323 RepID=K2JIU9_9RHOB|nr:MauE/DoxX family redox-associated membrane protein [Celeribacter baekdonensis]EKE74402.1 methylamine utilization protein MauE [Celeribacter baekdonensis B30]